MTGYGRGKLAGENYRVSVEIKTVNHRYCDFNIRIPREITPLEEKIKKSIQQYVARGRVDVFVNLEKMRQSKTKVRLDKELAGGYLDALKELENMELKQDVTTCTLARFPDVLMVESEEEDLETIWQDLSQALRDALTNLINSRESEGEGLFLDLKERLNKINLLSKGIETRSPVVINEYQKKLKERTSELLRGQEIDESRLTMEVVIFAERSSIAEELVRLKGHIKAFNKTLEQNGPVGRKLDFIVQEINRETNTVSSKANDLEISGQVVEVKSEIEKIREQVQNIE